MNHVNKPALTLSLLLILAVCSHGAAHARGGGQNVQSWPGYQQRLKESRGDVPNRSMTQPYIKPPAVYPGKNWKKRAKRK